MINIAKRNIRFFFRDRTAVFFSMLSVILIIGLYVLFLGDMIANSMGDVPDARFLIDSWIVAGLVASSSVTATLGALGIIVDDYVRNVVKDLYSAPLKKRTLIGGYLISSFSIGMIMSIFTLILGEIYILINGGQLLSILVLLKVLGIIVLSTFANSALLFFIISFIHSQSAFGTLSTIVGTIIGFLMGIYVPIGNLPIYVQHFVKIFPGSYSVSLFRTVIMDKPMSVTFEGAPEELVADFISSMGIQLEINQTLVSSFASILILLVTGFLFYGISILRLRIKKS
jgi:multidrug/hemolysin transport system permease protein